MRTLVEARQLETPLKIRGTVLTRSSLGTTSGTNGVDRRLDVFEAASFGHEAGNTLDRVQVVHPELQGVWGGRAA